MALEAVLFDLDNTLLGNSMETFVPAYFRALTDYVSHLVPLEQLREGLAQATAAMNANSSYELTNEDLFAQVFYPALECERATLEPVLERFYAEEFPRLESLTRRRPSARRLVEWAFRRGFQVVIATNPFFPRIAVEERLAWADVPVSTFDYDLVTTYETMHATKAQPAYYREIVERLSRAPDECLMVGDSWEFDILPAAAVGIDTYWITDTGELSTDGGEAPTLIGRGTLADLWARVADGELNEA